MTIRVSCLQLGHKAVSIWVTAPRALTFSSRKLACKALNQSFSRNEASGERESHIEQELKTREVVFLFDSSCMVILLIHR